MSPPQPPRRARFGGLAAWVRCILVGVGLFAGSARAADSLERQVKAAYLLNFSRYAEWPSAAFSSPGAPLYVCVFGQDPFGTTLDRTVAGRTSLGHPIAVKRVAEAPRPRECHMLFVPAAERARAAEVLARTRGQPIVTVGETEGFLEKGGMLNLVVVNARVRFEANLRAAVAAGIRLDASMLALARSVIRPEGRAP